MRAAVLDHYGPPSVLQVRDVADPRPVGRQILIRVAACGIDRHDVHLRAGQFKYQTSAYRQPPGSAPRAEIRLPLIPGAELSGTVVEMGKDATGFSPGDRVAALPHIGHCGKCWYCRNGHEEACVTVTFLGHDVDGAYAEYVLVTDGAVARVPDNVTDEDACLGGACIGVAVRAIYGNVQPHDTVLVTGAGGGLGVFALQVAALTGATVIALTTSAGKASSLQSLGASHVIVADRGNLKGYFKQVLELTRGAGANVVIDLVGGDVLSDALKCTAAYGRIVLVGDVAERAVPIHPSIVFIKGLSILSTTSVTLTHLEWALGLLAKKRISCPTTSFPLEETDRAHHAVETGAVFGRAVLVTGLGSGGGS